MDRVADFLPEFAARGKADITLEQVMTHRGGFPSGDVTKATWTDHALMRAQVCDFSLEWTPGSRLQYHARAAHLAQAMVHRRRSPARTYRDVIRDPRALSRWGWATISSLACRRAQQHRARTPMLRETRDNSADVQAAGLPSGGGYATARGMAAFYQMLGQAGAQRRTAVLAAADRLRLAQPYRRERRHAMGGIPMHRGLGPHVRGESDSIRGLGTIGAPATFGHGGAGSSYSWADPTSGVSFTYLTNYVQPDPWHSPRLDRVANLVHAAID